MQEYLGKPLKGRVHLDRPEIKTYNKASMVISVWY